MESLKNSYHRYLRYFIAKDNASATLEDKYMALAYAVRSEMFDHWIETQKYYHEQNVKRVYFLSTEYIFGKSLRTNIIKLGIERQVEDLAADLGLPLETIFEQEHEFELGDGDRAREAACLQSAMASLNIPAMGYGIRYDYALFKQNISNGTQLERPYDWLHKGHPWEIIRPEYLTEVSYYGHANHAGKEGNFQPHTWVDTDDVVAMPYDIA